ncbi:hypothetical protein FRC09_012546 [Ceratobasidium sp. 395]|nr:hypothetical protein FRC09_012546 [Ceratobasidium sp. 395]
MPSGPNRSHSSDSDGGSDSGSETSTLEYSHEPFETYQALVRELLCDLHGPGAGGVAEIVRLPGGGFNRIIGVTISLSSNSKHLILRVPRFGNSDITGQVAVLRHLRPFVPVPQVESYDATAENQLGEPYILMHRLPGQSLDGILGELDTDERCEIAKQVAHLIAKIHGVVLPPGVGPTYVDFAISRLVEFRSNAAQGGSNQQFKVKIYDALLHVVHWMGPMLAVGDRVVLCHRDFTPRNLLADRIGGGSRWEITAVLDWDDCEAAPYEIAAVWPDWLWQSKTEAEGNYEENEWDPDAPVPDDESERIKNAFLKEIEELEPDFLKTVRITRDRRLRQIYEWAREGIWSNEHIKEKRVEHFGAETAFNRTLPFDEAEVLHELVSYMKRNVCYIDVDVVFADESAGKTGPGFNQAALDVAEPGAPGFVFWNL